MHAVLHIVQVIHPGRKLLGKVKMASGMWENRVVRRLSFPEVTLDQDQTVVLVKRNGEIRVMVMVMVMVMVQGAIGDQVINQKLLNHQLVLRMMDLKVHWSGRHHQK
jgi:ABC-type antimicrobial peptide transport system ATPase subunit